MCTRVCEWMCWFCTVDVLEFHPVIAVYFFLHYGRFVDFCVFVNFPLISYGRSFLTEDHKCDYLLFFL